MPQHKNICCICN